jgi:hypothetical protein
MKWQTPTIGGVRKVIKTTNTVPGTTIAELGNQTITLAQLASIIGQIQAQQQNNGGGNIGGGSEGAIILGPGLSGGGPLVGNVPIRLTAPIPWGLDDGGGGGDGDPGPPGVAGVNGLNGATGQQGPMGPAVYLDAADGEDGWHAIPGNQGTAGVPGSNGATGMQGPMGPPIFLEAEQGEEGTFGPPGAPGLQGPQGVAGTGVVVAVPGTIADLTYWWNSSAILGSAGKIVPRLQELTPWVGGVFAFNTGTTTTIDGTQLNGLNVIKFPAGTGPGTYSISYPTTLSPVPAATSGATYFVVFKPSSAVAAAGQAFIGGAASALAFYMNTASGGTAISLVKSAVAVIGVATATWTTGTWYQANATYNAGSGAYAFRQARAAAGSGTGATTAGSGLLQFVGSDSNTTGAPLNTASMAEIIIYNRVLAGAEITSVENYLNTKWGV